MSHELELLPWGWLSFHWLTCRINDPNYCVFLSNHVLHFGCEGLWHRGRHLTCLPFGTAHSSLAIGQHPWVQLFFFLGHVSVQTKRNVNEKPLLLSHPPSPFNIYLCNRSEKSKCPSQGTPRANTVMHCMPDGLQNPPQSCTPAPHTTTSITPHPGQIKPSHSSQWVNEWVNANKQMNTLQQLSVDDLGLNTQTHSVYTAWHLRQLFLIEYCGIGSDKKKADPREQRTCHNFIYCRPVRRALLVLLPPARRHTKAQTQSTRGARALSSPCHGREPQQLCLCTCLWQVEILCIPVVKLHRFLYPTGWW